MLEHFVAPAEPGVRGIAPPLGDPVRGGPRAGQAGTEDAAPGPIPASAWPPAWTAPGVAERADAAGQLEWPAPAAPAGAGRVADDVPVGAGSGGLPDAPIASARASAVRQAGGALRHGSAHVRGAHARARATDPAVAPAAGLPGLQRIVVLGAPGAVGPVAAAIANEIRGRRPSVVAAWSPSAASADGESPATRAARRLAAGLAAEGHRAAPLGRLAWVSLPPDPRAAATDFEGLAAACGPAVLAVAGPRPDAFASLLRDADLVALVAGPDDALIVEVALESLAGLAAPVVPVAPPAGPGRLLASAGFGRLPAIRDAVRGRVSA